MAGFLDKAKDFAKGLSGKAKTTVGENQEKIDGGIDKAADFVDEKTKRKYTEKIEKAQGAAHRAVEKIGGDDKPGGDEPGGQPEA
jgi:antitoxin protein of toxin-antitoxin system